MPVTKFLTYGSMKELFEIIESKESRDFVGQITEIKKKLDAYPSTSKQNELLKKVFIGIEWLGEALDEWIEKETEERLCVIYGDLGIGKSAFAANYMHYNPKVAAGIFCEYDKPNFNEPKSVICTLAYLLACRLPAYRLLLANYLAENENWHQHTEAELFDYLLANPLNSQYIDGGHEHMAIIIDGLDE